MARKNILQPPQEISPTERGNNILTLLNNPANLQPQLVPNPHGHGETCISFAAFPPELSKNFPGSYISPKKLLEELGVEEKEQVKHSDILLGGSEAGEGNTPVFNVETGDNNTFGLTVWNGATNMHALALSRYASMTSETGFGKDATMRARYQDDLFAITKPAIESKKAGQRGLALRIHDDCLATGDSIVGLLATIMQDAENPQRAENLIKNGVEIMIDGPATAQGIVFLKKFCEANKIKLHIDAGYLAFGLSAGKELPDGRREHANYITYPDELVKESSLVAGVEWMRNKMDKNIYVVGDMGQAMEGIETKEMEGIRAIYELQSGIKMICPWNNDRNDPHGQHPNRLEDLPLTYNKDIQVETIYMPNGGYLPYEWDKQYGHQFKESNAIIIGASRMWLEGGYGALFYRGKKPTQD